MGNIFGKDKPLKEVLRENKRMINRAVRELDREKTTLEREEKRLTMEIKKAAKEQQMPSVKIMAKVSFISSRTLEKKMASTSSWIFWHNS
jgi:charged multivesicular body protein 2A